MHYSRLDNKIISPLSVDKVTWIVVCLFKKIRNQILIKFL